VLVSAKTEEAYYQREEVAAAIDLARKDPDTHRVVPVYLDAASAHSLPYGLRIKHGIPGEDATRLQAAGDKLAGLIDTLVARSEAA